MSHYDTNELAISKRREIITIITQEDGLLVKLATDNSSLSSLQKSNYGYNQKPKTTASKSSSHIFNGRNYLRQNIKFIIDMEYIIYGMKNIKS